MRTTLFLPFLVLIAMMSINLNVSASDHLTKKEQIKLPILSVYMDQVAIGHSSLNHDYQIQGIATCLALSIHDPESGLVFLAHLSAALDTDLVVKQALDFFSEKKIDSRNLKAQIAGGWVGWSEPYLENLVRSLEAGDVTIISVAPFANTGSGVNDFGPVVRSQTGNKTIRDFRYNFFSQKLEQVN